MFLIGALVLSAALLLAAAPSAAQPFERELEIGAGFYQPGLLGAGARTGVPGPVADIGWEAFFPQRVGKSGRLRFGVATTPFLFAPPPAYGVVSAVWRF